MNSTLNFPDGPKSSRLLRLLRFVFQPLEYLEANARIYGDTFGLPGKKTPGVVYFSHPEAIEKIFTSDCFRVREGNELLRFLLGDNSLILLDGDRHKQERKLLAPPFHGDRIRVYGQDICQITQQVSDRWRDEKPFNIREAMQDITLRVILKIVFGVETNSNVENLHQDITELLEILGSPIVSTSFFIRFLRTNLGTWTPWGKIEQKIATIDTQIYQIIQERRQEENYQRSDILSLILAARYEDGQSMSDREIRDELMTLLVAGHETTASALSWAFYWVDRQPEIRQKIIQELQALGKNPEPEKIAQLPYLSATCQETLRIYPIAINTFPRIVESPVEIGGYTLAKGTVIFPSVYLAHHRQQTYPQPKQFRPERFLERKFSPYEYFPFGGGNRRCLGLALAQYEMKLVLATILSNFQVCLVGKQQNIKPTRRGLTLAPPAGMRMRAKFYRINQN